MTLVSRILCVVDPTVTEQPALDRAAWFAKHAGARLDLHIHYYVEYLDGGRFFDSKSLEKARSEALLRQRERLEKLAFPLRNEGLQVETSAAWGRPLHDGIVQQVRARESDLVFKDTHHHSVLGRTLFSNSDWDLIRSCPVPLWLVKPVANPDNAKLLAAIDPFHEHDKPAQLDRDILALSRSIAASIDGTVHAFHSYDAAAAAAAAAGGLYGVAVTAEPALEDRVQAEHKQAFDELAAEFSIAPDNRHFELGRVPDKLPEVAGRLPAGLVVMGAVSRNRLRRLFVGAAAEQTLEALPCDLLVVKPAED